MRKLNHLDCTDCDYLRLEREAIHIHLGGATLAEAKEMAKDTRCQEHSTTQTEFQLGTDTDCRRRN